MTKSKATTDFQEITSMEEYKITVNDFICEDCALEFTARGEPSKDATWHNGECCICKETQPVTQVRDFGGVR